MPNDFRVRTNWRNHHKRKIIRRTMGADGVLYIEDLWSFAAEMHTDGVLRGMTAESMAAEVDYPGDPQRMLDACVAQQLIDLPGVDCDEYSLHDWSQHQPWLAHSAMRSAASRKAALEKHKKQREKNLKKKQTSCGPHAPRNEKPCAASAPSPTPTPTPDPNPNPKREKSDLQLLLEEGIPEDIARSHLKIRKAKKSPLTRRGLDLMKVHVAEAGLSLEEAIDFCISRNWASFQPGWYWREIGKEPPKAPAAPAVPKTQQELDDEATARARA